MQEQERFNIMPFKKTKQPLLHMMYSKSMSGVQNKSSWRRNNDQMDYKSDNTIKYKRAVRLVDIVKMGGDIPKGLLVLIFS